MATPPEIQPATLSDVDGMTDLFMECFNDDYFKSVFPPGGPGETYMRKAFTGFLRSKEEGWQEARASVVKEQGAIIACLLIWVVKPGDGGTWSWRRRWPAAEDGMNDDLLEEFFNGMQDQHHAALGTNPQIYLEIVFTKPSARRRGIASRLVAHAAAVADETGIPVYLDAEAKAVNIYEKAGFAINNDVEKTSEVMVSMTRPGKKQ